MNSMTYSLALILALLGADDPTEHEGLTADQIREYQTAISKAAKATVDPTDVADDSTAIGVEFLHLRDRLRHDRIGAHGDEFIGFLRGRARLKPPEWWVADFREGEVYPQRFVIFNSKTAERRWNTGEDDWDRGWEFSGMSNFEVEREKLTLNRADVTVTLLRKDFQKWLGGKRDFWESSMDNSDGAVASAIHDGSFAVAFECPTTGPGDPDRIFYGDAKTGKVLWSVVPTSLLPGGYSGRYGGAYLEIVLEQNRMLVYGVDGIGIYLHGFDRKTGERNLFFVTNFINEIKPAFENQ